MNHRIYVFLLSLTGLLLLLSSCGGDSPNAHRQEVIGFRATASQFRSLHSQTQPNRAEDEACIDVIPLRSSDPSCPTLYLHLFESDRPTAVRPEAQALRAAPVTAETIGHLGSYAYSYSADQLFADASVRSIYMNNLEVAQSASLWNTGYFWPGAQFKLSFFCYAPYNADGVTPAATTSGEPTLQYAVPAQVDRQQDLLAAAVYDKPGDYRQTIDLSFKHILSAVQFQVGSAGILPGSVSSISLKQVMSCATYTLGQDTWSTPQTPAAFTQTPAATLTGDADQYVANGDNTFMMLPQNFPADSPAQIEILYSDALSGQTHTLTADLKNSAWQKGKLYTYKISLSSIYHEDVLEVFDAATNAYTQGTASVTETDQTSNLPLPVKIKSYTRVIKQGTPIHYEPRAWQTEFSSDQGATWSTNAPAWLAGFPSTGAGTNSPAAENVTNATLSAATRTQSIGDAELKQAPLESDIIDLSMVHKDAAGALMGRTTANCYLVLHPVLTVSPWSTATPTETVRSITPASATPTTIYSRTVWVETSLRPS